MTGWTAVIIITALMLVAVIGLNVRLYRRMKAATAEAARREVGRLGRDGPRPSRPIRE